MSRKIYTIDDIEILDDDYDVKQPLILLHNKVVRHLMNLVTKFNKDSSLQDKYRKDINSLQDEFIKNFKVPKHKLISIVFTQTLDTYSIRPIPVLDRIELESKIHNIIITNKRVALCTKN